MSQYVTNRNFKGPRAWKLSPPKDHYELKPESAPADRLIEGRWKSVNAVKTTRNSMEQLRQLGLTDGSWCDESITWELLWHSYYGYYSRASAGNHEPPWKSMQTSRAKERTMQRICRKLSSATIATYKLHQTAKSIPKYSGPFAMGTARTGIVFSITIKPVCDALFL